MAAKSGITKAIALAGIMFAAPAMAEPPAPAEVIANWKSYLSDSVFTYYRDPVAVRDGTQVTVWKISVPIPSMLKIGAPIGYEQATYDCSGKRKKIAGYKRFNADGSARPVAAGEVKFDQWSPVQSASDLTLQEQVCASR